jgi:hypothetical protein
MPPAAFDRSKNQTEGLGDALVINVTGAFWSSSPDLCRWSHYSNARIYVHGRRRIGNGTLLNLDYITI